MPDRATVRAWIGIGANLGDARRAVDAAIEAITRLDGVARAVGSSLYRSAPIDAAGPDFVNAVVRVETTLDAGPLLAALQTIEQRAGRLRPYPNAPRTLDLDLLAHGHACLRTPTLSLPHPRLHRRAFVLLPLLELDPALELPGLGPLADHRPAVADQRIERLHR